MRGCCFILKRVWTFNDSEIESMVKSNDKWISFSLEPLSKSDFERGSREYGQVALPSNTRTHLLHVISY